MRLRRMVIAVFALVLLSGCWDIKEIEDVGIITGMGLDVSENSQLTMVNQYVVPGKIPTQQDTSQQSVPFQNINISGETFFEIIRKNSLESNRPPNYTHLKSILASTELFEKERADQVIDLFIRDHEFRRTTPVFITQDAVEEVLNAQPTKELFPAIQIKALSENYKKNNSIPSRLSIGDMSQSISEKKSFLVPGITLENGNIKSAGAGIIEAESSNYIGWVDVEDIEGIRYMHNNVQGGSIYLNEEKVDEGPMILEIKGANTKFKTKVTDDQLTMDVHINISSVLAEDWGMGRNVFNKGWKNEIESMADEVIKEKIERVLELAQQEYGIDFLNISGWVHIHEPAYWKKHEKDWDEVFSNMEINVKVNTKITDFGTQNFNTDDK